MSRSCSAQMTVSPWFRSADRLGEQGGGRDQVRFAREGEAEQERRRGRRVCGAVAVQLVQADAGAAGPPSPLLLLPLPPGPPGEGGARLPGARAEPPRGAVAVPAPPRSPAAL